MDERVINLKTGGSIPKIREGQEVFHSDSVLLKWNSIGGGDILPSKKYLPMQSTDSSKVDAPVIAPKIAEKEDDNDTSKKEDGSDSDSDSDSGASKKEDGTDNDGAADKKESILTKDDSDESDPEKKSTEKMFKSDEEIEKESLVGGGDELSTMDLSKDVLFATLTNLFISTKNNNNIADILEHIAFDMREMRFMMEVEHKARRGKFTGNN